MATNENKDVTIQQKLLILQYLNFATYRDPLDQAILEDAPAVTRRIVEVWDHALVVLLASLEYLDQHEKREVHDSDGVVQLSRLTYSATQL